MKAINIITLTVAAFISFFGFTSADDHDEIDCSSYPTEVSGMGLACNRMYKPVCGTDGQTYNNKCMLCDERMKLKKSIGFKHTGSCKGIKLKECDAIKNKMVCTMEYLPHCGSDGVSYSNRCNYCHAQNSNPELTLMFEGSCNKNKE